MARFIEQEKKDDTRKEEDRINTKERENEEILEEELGSSLKLANLGGADFNTIEFSEANFKEIANFNFGEFFRIANFKGTNFTKEAEFGKTKFHRAADFSTAKFRGETWFTGADFTEYATFSFAVFFDKTYFKDSIQEGKTIGVFNGKTSFNYVYFEAKERIVFDVEDLSKASFMDTDITRVSFSDRVRWGKEDKFKVIEEEVLEKDLAQTPIMTTSDKSNIRRGEEARS